VKDFVYVRHKGTPKKAKIDKFADFWIAQIEEIRQWKDDDTQKPVVLLLVGLYDMLYKRKRLGTNALLLGHMDVLAR